MAKTSLIINATVITAAADRGLCGIYINEEGRVADIFKMEDYDASRYPKASELLDASGNLVCSGLIDTHIHGIGGFSTDQAEASSILGMSERLASFGVTSFIPTLYAGSPDKMEKEIKAVVSAMGKEKGARILGVNLEGPFLSPKKSGAQDSRSLTLPDVDVAKRLFDAAQGKALAMTMAPELEGAREVAAIAAQYGVVLLMGHTSATYEQALMG
ncbi:MAG: amidohydrolase family protein, partial [Spirochaetales bacterium]|nr:amidohydrolase family protein [Spirochaetales bacterium]